MKKRYVKPSMKVYEIGPQRIICTSDPQTFPQPGGPGQF